MNSKVDLLKSPSPARALVTVKSPSSTAAGSAELRSVTAVDFWSSTVRLLVFWSPTVKVWLPQTTPAGVAEAVVVSSSRVRTVPTGKVPLYTAFSPTVTVMEVLPPVRAWLTVPGACHPG